MIVAESKPYTRFQKPFCITDICVYINSSPLNHKRIRRKKRPVAENRSIGYKCIKAFCIRIIKTAAFNIYITFCNFTILRFIISKLFFFKIIGVGIVTRASRRVACLSLSGRKELSAGYIFWLPVFLFERRNNYACIRAITDCRNKLIISYINTNMSDWSCRT